jgi:hypothetical protein
MWRYVYEGYKKLRTTEKITMNLVNLVEKMPLSRFDRYRESEDAQVKYMKIYLLHEIFRYLREEKHTTDACEDLVTRLMYLCGHTVGTAHANQQDTVQALSSITLIAQDMIEELGMMTKLGTELFEGSPCFSPLKLQLVTSESSQFMNTGVQIDYPWPTVNKANFRTGLQNELGDKLRTFSGPGISSLETYTIQLPGILRIDRTFDNTANQDTYPLPLVLDIKDALSDPEKKQKILQWLTTLKQQIETKLATEQSLNYQQQLRFAELVLKYSNAPEYHNARYSLLSRIEHIGNTQSGHYIALVKYGNLIMAADDQTVTIQLSSKKDKILTKGLTKDFLEGNTTRSMFYEKLPPADTTAKS